MRFYLIIWLMLYGVCSNADTWRPAKQNSIISDSGKYVVRIEPGESLGDVYGFGGAKKGRYAKAHLYRYKDDSYGKYSEFVLLNPVSPVISIIANNGNLITIDNWHNLGVGEVIVLYGSKGKILKKYTLRDIYSEEELTNIKTTVSSFWWRCDKIPPYLDDRNQYYIVHDFLGKRIKIDVNSGELVHAVGSVGCLG